MPNTHQIVDSDSKFSIDPVTRTISNPSRKTRLIQYDHNSEKISFIMPRIVEGHDMTLCNNVRIQYINLDDETQHKKSVGVYSVDDITQNEEDDTISFSWLISRNATKYVGTLNFLIQFECILDDGTIEYSWHTDAFKGITVSEGMDVEDTIVHYYPDIFEQWKNEVIQMTANTLSQYATTAYVDTSISGLGNIVTEEKLSEDLSHKINSVNNVIPDENGNVEIDVVLYSSQRLSSEQQEIARTNIDAVSTDSLEEISPDDNIVDGKPWTSRKIVDTLCPPFDVSGSVVTCHPVERYPLDVKVSWEPVQEGEGDPSPENIRPITGRDAVQMTRCGKNILNPKYIKITKNSFLINIKKSNFPPFVLKKGKTYTFSVECDTEPSGIYIDKYTGETLSSAYGKKSISYTPTKDIECSFEVYWADATNLPTKANVKLELGSTATPYEPYIGDTYTAELPETVYGGEVDAVTGEGQETMACQCINEETKITYNSDYKTIYVYLDHLALQTFVPFWSHFGNSAQTVVINSRNAVHINAENLGFASAGEFKSYCAAQYAAGTPVQIAYKLAEPVPFTATGTQPIPALSGVNTLYTDSGDISVSGRTDMIWLTQSLIDRIAALETAAVSE